MEREKTGPASGFRPVLLSKEDADAFCALRTALLCELGEAGDGADARAFAAATREYYLSNLGKGLFCFGVFADGTLAAAGALCLFSRLPYPENLSGSEGYILSVYTLPRFRRRGFADGLVDAMIRFAEKQGVGRLWTGSSDAGRAVYQKAGFAEKGGEMELFLPVKGRRLPPR